MAQRSLGLPAGPLAAYLGVRNANQDADEETIGLLAKMQAVKEATKLREEAVRAATADRSENRNLARETRDLTLAERADRQSREEALRRELAGRDETLRREIAAGRPVPPPPAPSFLSVQDPNSPTGWSHRDTRSGAMIPGAPPPAAAARKTDKEIALDGGKKQVSDVIGNLHGLYQELSRQGAIADTSKGATFNVARAIASSTPGQMVGQAVGTQAQGIRNQVNMTRPLLMNAIRQATGQSAKSLDSNVELKFYLQAATDPQKDIASNLAALDHLDKAYGLGIGINADPAAVAALRKLAPSAGLPAQPVPDDPPPGAVRRKN